MSLTIRPISPTELDTIIPELVELLRDTVNGGAALGFMAPLSREEAREYWHSIRPALQSGSRLLLAAYSDDGIVGSVQMNFPPCPNARHRAEIQKLFVAPALRGQGVGRALMIAIHDGARERGRSLLLLNTRHRGPAEGFYKDLGYREIGVIPGYAAEPTGERYADVALYQELSL
jgi:ribosomal protein S18 acetylase RimI-like enzyme